MFEKYRIHVERLVHTAINTPGDTSPTLRQSIFNRGRSLISNEPTKNQGADSLVPELAEIVDKVTFSQEDIRDEDILALQTAGYSDDAVIEIINFASHWQQASDVWKP